MDANILTPFYSGTLNVWMLVLKSQTREAHTVVSEDPMI
jgi:hypothetical protein